MTNEDFLKKSKDLILNISSKYGAVNVRVFGSYSRGEATEKSDLDLLVKYKENTSLFDHIGLIQDLEELLKIKVDVVSENALHSVLKNQILKEAKPL